MDLNKRLVICHFKWWLVLFFIFCFVAAAFLWACFSEIPTSLKTPAIYLNSEGFEFMRSGVDGFLQQAPIPGESIKAGEKVLTVENPKTKETWEGITPNSGEVVELLKRQGEWVFQRETIAVIQKAQGDRRFFSFLPFEKGQLVKEGMNVFIQGSENDDMNQSGKVVYVSPFVVSQDRLVDLLGDENLVRFFTHGEPVMEIQIEPETKSEIPARFLSNAIIVLSSRRVISYLIPTRHRP